MERSVDSIGTCSLDVEASAEISDWSEPSSLGTLRSASPPKTPSAEPHLPSYLSLACTVNGYSTTTNYDPVRLAKSRDASPHRLDHENVTGGTPRNYYTAQNNLLSPPNLVPLPTTTLLKHHRHSSNMSDFITTTTTQHHQQHQEFYSSSKSVTLISNSGGKSKAFSSATTYSKLGGDTIDACIENGHHHYSVKATKCVTSFERDEENFTTGNTVGNGTLQSSNINSSKITNGKAVATTTESKSFIQQRVERLYGPGALAQGFFVSKRQKTLSESEQNDTSVDNLSRSLNNSSLNHNTPTGDNVLEENGDAALMKQSNSSPALPVLRHLRPEFRAQLPIVVSPRKSTGGSSTDVVQMQKSSTVPTFKEEVPVDGAAVGGATVAGKVNGHGSNGISSSEGTSIVQSVIAEEIGGDKDGHYFLRILQNEASRLLKKADEAEAELSNENLSEEVTGKIRSAAGKGRLLVSQKMQQFKGLCTNNITQSEGEAFPTTNADLQGFWDMVMLQVDQVDALYKELEVLKANNWKEPEKTTVSKTSIGSSNGKVRKIATAAGNKEMEKARKEREAQRKKMIEERRKAMKAAAVQQKLVENIEIFVPKSS